MSDKEIDNLTKLNANEAEEFLDEKYAWIDGEFHKENDTIFPMDKGWDITKYLIQKLDTTPDKKLLELNAKYIKSEKVKIIYNLIKNFSINDLMSIYNKTEMIEKDIYCSEMIENKEYIEYHLKAYKLGFKKASELKDGIVVYFY